MLKEPTQTLDGPALSEEVYHLALERIKALMGCTQELPEENELIDWTTIADAYEHAQAASSLTPALDSVPNDQESNRARPIGCDEADRTHSDGHPLLGAETRSGEPGRWDCPLRPGSSRLSDLCRRGTASGNGDRTA